MIGDRLGDFVNLSGCFIGYDNYPEFDNNIFLLFSTSESKIFKNFLERLKYIPTYNTTIPIGNTHEMFVFNVSKEHQKNYDYFKQSKYSQLDEKYKKHIVRFHNYSMYGEGDTICKILDRDESLYVIKEEAINEGIPERDWTRIPRNIEIGNALKEEEEIFSDELVKQEIKT